MSINQGVGPVVGTSVSATPGSVGSITYTLTVSNALGTVTANVPVTVTPPVPRCGIGKICGHVYSAERPAQALHDIHVSLYYTTVGHGDGWARGARTDASGYYEFTVPTDLYGVRAEPDRTEQAIPDSYKTTTNNVIGANDFKMRYIPAVVTVTGAPDTFVAFTAAPIGAVTGPALDAIPMETAVIDLNNRRDRPLRTGTYYMTCWILDQTVWPYVYVQNPSHLINGGAQLWPQDAVTEACP